MPNQPAKTPRENARGTWMVVEEEMAKDISPKPPDAQMIA